MMARQKAVKVSLVFMFVLWLHPLGAAQRIYQPTVEKKSPFVHLTSEERIIEKQPPMLTMSVGNAKESNKLNEGAHAAADSTRRFLRKFVPNCQVILFGELLKMIPSETGESYGTLIERTEDAVLINGRPYLSKYQESKKPLLTNQYEEAKQRGAIIEEAAQQFRAQHREDSSGACLVGDKLFGGTPRPFYVERYGETVELAIKPGLDGMDYIYVTYKGVTAGLPLHPLSAPSPEERAERQLDNAYHFAITYARPGTIVLVTRGGSFTPYPMEKAEALLSALAKIPALAVPVAPDPWGEMVYRPLKIDGFFFGPDVVATFADNNSRR